MDNLTVELFPLGHLYNVTFDGELIVEHSRDPETDLARALKARGLTGMVDMLDGATGRLRAIINIEKAARLKVEEGPNGPRFVKYRPQTVVERDYSPEERSLEGEVVS
jgi:hypothetical protein